MAVTQRLPPASAGVYVDESKHPAYVIAAVYVAAGDSDSMRKQLRQLLQPGQSRLHMSKESHRRQRELAQFLVGHGLHIRLYRGGVGRPQRDEQVARMAADAIQLGASTLVLESAQGVDAADRSTIGSVVSRYESHVELAYHHEVPQAEPLLWLADMAAWMWNSRKYPRKLDFTVVDC